MNKIYDWSGKTIVIADDDSINIELIKLMLSKTSANIVLFENGEQVISYMSSNAADVVVLDIQMPVLGGFETIQRLKEIGCKSTVIALTALNTSVELQKYKDYGFDQVLEKPIRRNVILELINEYL